jgi:HEAT repeat protein
MAALVMWMMAAIIALNLVFLCFVFYRRLSRQRYFETKDAARARFKPVIERFVAEEMTVDQGVGVLQEATSAAERDAVEEVLLNKITPEIAGRASELFFALGYVDRWARLAFGKKRAAQLVEKSVKRQEVPISTKPDTGVRAYFRKLRLFSVPRAVAVDHLGRLAPEYAQVFLAEALHDPGTEVRRFAVAAMGRRQHPAAIPLLFDELRKAIEAGNDVSLRSTKAALVCYELDDLHHFVPFVAHPHRRMRFFAIDIIREICNRAARDTLLNKNDFPPELYDVVLDRAVVDEFSDVRARSAAVVKHFRDARALKALRDLIADDNDFVRLHAVRASADRFYSQLVPDAVARLSDVKWRVREAAVRALLTFGSSGSNEVYKLFIHTSDPYVSEQISDEIQRGGLVQDLIAALKGGGDDAQLASAVCEKMARMGKRALLTLALATVQDAAARVRLMDSLAAAPSNEFLALLDAIAKGDAGPVGNKAAAVLRRIAEQGPQIAGAAHA